MRRSRAVHLTLVVSVASLLADCDKRSTRACVDANQTATDDWNCGQSNGRYHWYYVPGHPQISNGMRLSGGSLAAPAEGFAGRSGSVRGGIGGAGEAATGHGFGGGGE